jgi:hypothetical protein
LKSQGSAVAALVAVTARPLCIEKSAFKVKVRTGERVKGDMVKQVGKGEENEGHDVTTL